MKHFKLTAISLAMMFAGNVLAETPDASVLVGQTYGGVHYSHFSADSERKKIEGVSGSSLHNGGGFGAEFGYRFSEFNELRIKYTDLSIDANNSQYGEQDGSSVAIDVLHFMAPKVYFVGGFKKIDLEDDEVSANVGLGYRHHFTNRFAAYAEGKTHFQFEENYFDFNASIGLIYFFGENAAKSRKSSTTRKPTVSSLTSNKQIASTTPQKFVEQKVIEKDSDKDGVINDKDKCPNTPKTHMVDNLGCTVFSETVQTMRLLINFDNNSVEVKDEYKDQLDKAASFLSKYPETDLTIEGHTSAAGSAKYNKALSLKRAQAVVDKLVADYGINADRLNAVGFGEENIINAANTDKAHAENRRIMATVKVRDKVAVSKM